MKIKATREKNSTGYFVLIKEIEPVLLKLVKINELSACEKNTITTVLKNCKSTCHKPNVWMAKLQIKTINEIWKRYKNK
jgi:hypothetical protein